jgi:hypothetical protein
MARKREFLARYSHRRRRLSRTHLCDALLVEGLAVVVVDNLLTGCRVNLGRNLAIRDRRRARHARRAHYHFVRSWNRGVAMIARHIS